LPIPNLQAGAPPLRPIAQLWNSYILAEGPGGILVIDQHLAHERVIFDRLQEAPEPQVQPLANPVTLQLTHREALGADEWLPHLKAIGFDLEAFGRDAFLIRAVPDFVRGGTEIAAVRRILDDLAEAKQSGGNAAIVPGKVVATAACKAAVKKGTRLGREEMDQILGDLSRSANPHTCPHGCAIAVEIPFTELLRRFKRI
jgi:DNA mismatch repair protein MutL